MTDPRITECAKALKLKAREIGLPVALTADQAADLARACALTWLQQKASPSMGKSPSGYEAFHAEDYEEAYTDMCEVAAKEIAQ